MRKKRIRIRKSTPIVIDGERHYICHHCQTVHLPTDLHFIAGGQGRLICRAFQACRNKEVNTGKFKSSIEEVKAQLPEHISIDESTYKGLAAKARFIDTVYGEWTAAVHSVLGGKGHVLRGRARTRAARIKPATDVIACLPSHISMDADTYVSTGRKAAFHDIAHGVFWATPNHVMSGKDHPDRGKEKQAETNLMRYGFSNPAASPDIKAKIKKTNLERYGFEHAMSHPGVALKCARNQQRSTMRHHWKTQEELVCQSSYEEATIDWLAQHQIDFDWQISFRMPDGHSYTIDLYLKNEDTYVEIKGYFRDDAQAKWDWFHSKHPNSELWQKAELKQLGINIK